MIKGISYAAVVSAAALIGGSAAVAHVGLAPAEATGNANVVATFTVGHGCDGSPTTRVRLQIPEGVTAVKPAAKAGWEIEMVIRPYRTAVVSGTQTLTQGVAEVIWSGGKLQDGLFDDFRVQFRLPDVKGVMYFPVVQECEKGVHRWIETPAAGATAQEPAPKLTIK